MAKTVDEMRRELAALEGKAPETEPATPQPGVLWRYQLDHPDE